MLIQYDSSKDERKYEPVPQGLHPALCVDVVDKGVVAHGKYDPKHKIVIVWQVDKTKWFEDEEYRLTIGQFYNVSMHPKSTLRQMIESWFNKRFSGPLITFDTEKLIGHPAQIQVMHREDHEGRTWANVVAVLPPGDIRLQPDGKYVRQKDREGYVAPHRVPANDNEAGGVVAGPKTAGEWDVIPAPANDNDDIPF